MTTASKITLVRVVLIPVFMVLLLCSGGNDALRWAALGVFVVASISDFVDGYIARLSAAQQSVEDGFGTAADNVKSMEAVARQQANYIAQIGQMQTDFMREVNSFQTRMDAFTKAYVDNTNISTNALHKVSEELKASGESLLTAHKAFSKGVNGELQHAFGMFDANMQDIIDKLTGIINSISASVKDMPAIMTDTANAYEDQLRQLTRYMEHMQRLLEDGMRRAGRGGGQ